MKAGEYTVEVTRTEIRSVSEADLERERIFQAGRADRKAGKPCASANGAYLNGWYNPDTLHYYITADAAHLLAKGGAA
jgi:hypothetical protein